MANYHEYVDVHGAIRDQAIASFRLIPQLGGLTDEQILADTWDAYQMLIADLLDAQDCPNCEGHGELDPGGGNLILCPTCGEDGWTYGRVNSDTPHPPKNESLPPAPTGGGPKRRPDRPAPIDTSGRP
jgi:hypothetical protein